MPLGGGNERGPVQPVGKNLEQEIRDIIAQEEELVKKGEEGKKPLDAETLAQVSKNLPRLIQRVLQKIEASQVYQTFKLAGTDYIVHDRRETKAQPKEKEKGESIAEESKISLEALLIQKGKLVPAKEKEYENYLADPDKKSKLPEQQAAEERLLKLFTRFEKALLKRFEEGATIAEEAEKGRSSFWKKTAGQWREFFSHFVKRTVKRHLPLEQLDGWIFRGLVRKDSRATIISDLALSNGQVEKFIRFRLSPSAQNLASLLASLEPWVRLSREDLREHTPEELEYLAIKQSEADAAFAQAPTRGKFLGTAQAEEKVASELGLQLGAQLKEKEKVLRDLGRRKKGFGFGLGEEEASQEPSQQFVPWWQFGPFKRRPGPVRWFVITTYLVIISLLLLGLWSLVPSP